MADMEETNEVLGSGPPEDDGKRQEYDAVKKLREQHKQAREFDKSARKAYAVDRRYAAGTSDMTWAVTTNLIGSFIDILVAYLYARDPDVDARKVERVEVDPQVRADAVRQEIMAALAQDVPEAAGEIPPELIDMQVQAQLAELEMEDRKQKAEEAAFTKTLELVVSRLWKDGRLKKAVRKQVRSVLSIGPGWIKVIMQIDKARDPIVESALNDAQENLQRIQALQKQIESGEYEGGETQEQKIKELEDHITGLEAEVEIVVRKGLAIDFLRGEDVQVSLDVSDIEDYLEANWVSNDIYVPKDELPGMFPRLTPEQVKGATSFYQQRPKDGEQGEQTENLTERDAEKFTQHGSGSGEEQVEFACITELWDRRDNHIKTMVHGVPCWAREPYSPAQASRRFYPYFYLAFYEVDNSRHPQSTAGRLKKLQDEYSAARSNFRKTRERAIPGIIFNAEQIDQENARKLEQSTQQEFVGIQATNPSLSFRDLFAEKPTAKVDPALFDTSPILRDMEKISGVQESLQQSVVQPKTATEAEIQQSGFAARSSTDRDALEDMLTDLAQYTAELALQTLDFTEVQRIAGEAAFWPENMHIDDITTMVEVDIEAGSTGKPNTAAERESWSAAMPLIKECMMQIGEFRTIGNEPMAAVLTELLRETLNRMGDRVDVEKFIPQVTPAALAPQAVPGEPAPEGEGGGGPAGPGPEPERPPEVPTQGVADRMPAGVV